MAIEFEKDEENLLELNDCKVVLNLIVVEMEGLKW